MKGCKGFSRHTTSRGAVAALEDRPQWSTVYAISPTNFETTNMWKYLAWEYLLIRHYIQRYTVGLDQSQRTVTESKFEIRSSSHLNSINHADLTNYSPGSGRAVY